MTTTTVVSGPSAVLLVKDDYEDKIHCATAPAPPSAARILYLRCPLSMTVYHDSFGCHAGRGSDDSVNGDHDDVVNGDSNHFISTTSSADDDDVTSTTSPSSSVPDGTATAIIASTLTMTDWYYH